MNHYKSCWPSNVQSPDTKVLAFLCRCRRGPRYVLLLHSWIFSNGVSGGCDQSSYGLVMVLKELSHCFVGLKGMRVISYCWYRSGLTSWNHHSLPGRVLLRARAFAVGIGYPKPSLICARCVPYSFSNANVWAMLSCFEREFCSLVNLRMYESLIQLILYFFRS